MSQELIYTSATRGLKPGTRGFTTVACTPGMSKNLKDFLESLSGYKHIYAPGSREAYLNPINYSCLRFTMDGSEYVVISRIADCGLDHTQRSNKIAHHIVLDAKEVTEVGPAITMQQVSLFQEQWSEDPKELPRNKAIEAMHVTPAVCRSWEAATGDAGWGGTLAKIALEDPTRKVHIVYQPGTDLLSLFAESQALLPPRRRWSISFATYHSSLPPGVACSWRGILDGTPESEQVRRMRNELVLDLSNLDGEPPSSELVDAARTGIISVLEPTSTAKETFEENPQLNQPLTAKAETQERVNEARIAKNASVPPPMLSRQVNRESVIERPLTLNQKSAGNKLQFIAIAIGLVFVSLLLGVGVGAMFFKSAENITVLDNESGTQTIEVLSEKHKPIESKQIEDLDLKNKSNSKLQEIKKGYPSRAIAKRRQDVSNSITMNPEVNADTKAISPSKTNPEVEKPALELEKVVPDEFFIDFRKEVTLPPMPLRGGINDSDFLTPVLLGKFYSDDFTVDLDIAQSSLSAAKLIATKLPNESYQWKILAKENGTERELALVRMHAKKVTMRWLNDPEKTSIRAALELRSSFLIFKCRKINERKIVALQEPYRRDAPVKFDATTANEVLVKIHQSSEEDKYAVPAGQSISVTGKVRDLPYVTNSLDTTLRDIDFEFDANEAWHQQLDSKDSLRLITVLDEGNQSQLRIKIQYRTEKQNDKFIDLNKKIFRLILSKRVQATERAINKKIKYHWRKIDRYIESNVYDIKKRQTIYNEINEAWLRRSLFSLYLKEANLINQPKLGIEKLIAIDRYGKWLRKEPWELFIKKINFQCQQDYKLSVSKEFQRLNIDLPLSNLILWDNVLKKIKKMEFHFLISRHLSVSDSKGIDPPLQANVMIIGNPKRQLAK